MPNFSEACEAVLFKERGESEVFGAFVTGPFLVRRATNLTSRTAGPSTPLPFPLGTEAPVGMTNARVRRHGSSSAEEASHFRWFTGRLEVAPFSKADGGSSFAACCAYWPFGQ